jgi:hypothetical protein
MYFRTKRSGGFDYLPVVESHRVDGKPRQSVVATLGRLDALKASGELDRLVRSGARFTESAMLLSAVAKGKATTIEASRIGPPLLFERLWRASSCRAVIEDLLVDRKFEFPLERAIFLTMLHRIMDPGSDRAAEKWRAAYTIGGMDQIDLHHLYRAMAWLGEELADQTGRGLAPRTTKDLIEEQVFSSRRSLFNDVGLAIFDTTSLYFEGDGGETLGHNGHSKDARPDLHQMVLGVVIDENGRPICSEMWPGNTADVTTLIPLVSRLRERFLLHRVCIIADRGMVSAKTIATLEANGIEYILGVRERRSVEVAAVLANTTPFVSMTVPKANGRGSLDLQVKEVVRTVRTGQPAPVPLYRLLQRGGSPQRCRRPGRNAGQTGQGLAPGRQGHGRQQGLPPLPQDHRQQPLHDRPRAGRRRGQVRWPLRHPHQCPDLTACGRTALSRAMDRGGYLQDRQIHHRHAPDLSSAR